MQQRELAKRVAVAAVGIPVTVAILYVGGWVLALALAALAAGASWELYRMAATAARPFALLGALGAAALVLGAAPAPYINAAAAHAWLVTLLLFALTSIGVLWRRGPDERPLLALAVTVAGAVYTGGTLLFAVLLRHFPLGADAAARAAAGTVLVLFPIAITWINDSAAFFVGRRWGRRKLSPRVSPGKSVEGGIGGALAGALTGAAYAQWVLPAVATDAPGALWGAFAGAVIAVLAQIGDLVESLFKREAGVKDSGSLLPGHGGVLDRFDALFFTIPAGYFLLRAALGA